MSLRLLALGRDRTEQHPHTTGRVQLSFVELKDLSHIYVPNDLLMSSMAPKRSFDPVVQKIFSIPGERGVRRNTTGIPLPI